MSFIIILDISLTYSHEYLLKMCSLIAKIKYSFVFLNIICIFVLGDREMSMRLDWTGIRPGLAEPGFTAEYIAASEAAKEVVWLKNFLMDLEVVPFE